MYLCVSLCAVCVHVRLSVCLSVCRLFSINLYLLVSNVCLCVTLSEILMTASPNIKTPAMDVPLRASGEDAIEDSAFLKKRFTKVTLSQVMHCFIVQVLCTSQLDMHTE